MIHRKSPIPQKPRITQFDEIPGYWLGGQSLHACELTVTQWFCPLGLSARASLFKRNLIVTRQMLTSGSIISSSLFFSNIVLSCSIVHVATEHQSCCSLIQQIRLIRALRLVFSHPSFLFLLTISSTHRYPYCTSIECILQHSPSII
jgi:hypothetical protein